MPDLLERISRDAVNYPEALHRYLQADAPENIWARGNLGLLESEGLWALFCSSKCPGAVILETHELAQRFKDAGMPTIGGYHSPVEQECLRVLLRGSQPIILCPARGIERMRLKSEWRQAFVDERLLIVSMFGSNHRRTTLGLARRRNLFVAALADKICIAHASAGSQTLAFARQVLAWDKPVFTFDVAANGLLLEFGAEPFRALYPA